MHPGVLARATFLALLAAGLHLGALRGGFLQWDDRDLVLENPVAALSPGAALRSAFSRPAGVTYWPLRDLSYALDRWAWGGFDAFGFHLDNLLLYAGVTAGLYLVSRRALGEAAAFLGAALFAVHPLHAEPVAWVSGRKDLLCAAWLVLAWGALAAAPGEGPARRLLRFSVGLAAYVAACLSKTAALPFPLAWWAYDRWLAPPAARWGRLERAPFLVAMALLAAGQLAFSLGAGTAGRYLATGEGLRQALLTPVSALMDQLGALLLPLGLSPVYPLAGPSRGGLGWVSRGAVLVAAAVAALALRRLRGLPAGPARRAFLFGTVWTALFLLPVIGLGVATATPRADRYAFLPSAGFCLAAGALLAGWCRGDLRRAALGTLLAAWAAAAWAQGGTWRDDLSLWRPAVRRDPGSFLARGGMAWGWVVASRPAEARRDLERMLRLDPSSPVAHHQLGGLLRALGDLPGALAEYAAAERRYAGVPKGRPGVRVAGGYRREHVHCLLDLGDALQAAGDSPGAVRSAEQAVGEDPGEPRAWAALGLWRSALGDLPGAAEACERAIALAPELPDGHWNRARVAQREGEAALAASRPAEARLAFARLLEECRWLLGAGDTRREMLSRLAFALVRLGALAEDPAEGLARRAEAEAVYRAMGPETLSAGDRWNLAMLLRDRAAVLAAAGEIPRAYQAMFQASVLLPEDPGLREAAEQLSRALQSSVRGGP